MHLEAAGAAGHLGTDLAEADDAQRLAPHLEADEPAALPLAARQRGVRGGDLAGKRQHERHGVLCRRNDVAGRRVDDDDAALRGRLEVDVVDADAGSADDLQPACVLQDVARDLGLAADDQGVVIGDERLELLGLKPRFDVDFHAATLKGGDPVLGDWVGDEDAGNVFERNVAHGDAGHLGDLQGEPVGEAGAAAQDLGEVAVGDAEPFGEVLELPAAADEFGLKVVARFGVDRHVASKRGSRRADRPAYRQLNGSGFYWSRLSE